MVNVDDESAEDHHLYSTEEGVAAAGSPSTQAHEQSSERLQATEEPQRNNYAADDNDEQQSVIVYAKLPSDRSELRGSHLLLHSLRKEDHGRYECVVENEVATLIASTMLYIEGEL